MLHFFISSDNGYLTRLTMFKCYLNVVEELTVNERPVVFSKEDHVENIWGQRDFDRKQLSNNLDGL